MTLRAYFLRTPQPLSTRRLRHRASIGSTDEVAIGANNFALLRLRYRLVPILTKKRRYVRCLICEMIEFKNTEIVISTILALRSAQKIEQLLAPLPANQMSLIRLTLCIQLPVSTPIIGIKRRCRHITVPVEGGQIVMKAPSA